MDDLNKIQNIEEIRDFFIKEKWIRVKSLSEKFKETDTPNVSVSLLYDFRGGRKNKKGNYQWVNFPFIRNLYKILVEHYGYTGEAPFVYSSPPITKHDNLFLDKNKSSIKIINGR